jgi:acetyl-CoA synthetase
MIFVMSAEAQGTLATSGMPANSAAEFLRARDFLLANHSNYAEAYSKFRWPALKRFNWAIDYFDVMAADNREPALTIDTEDGVYQSLSFAAMSERSNQVANFFQRLGVRRGERILVMLGNEVPLWESMLAACKLGAVIMPTSLAVSTDDLNDRLERGQAQYVIASLNCKEKFSSCAGMYTRILVGGSAEGWVEYEQAYVEAKQFAPEVPPQGDDPFLLYFTSGTTAKPKLVLHSQHSYPVGHLSTMYWVGIKPGDLHWNISSPGWAKHAWSSLFAPWNAGACILASNDTRFSASRTLERLERFGVTTLCAPPTAWRMLVKEELRKYKVKLREVVSAGEPLNPEVVRQVEHSWGITIRDGYGQTETTAIIGNTPGQKVKAASMGRPLPGYRIEVFDIYGQPVCEGELCVDCQNALGLMTGYETASDSRADGTNTSHHATGDVVRIDEEGYLFFIGRIDDVFKSSDYRISPFELESAAVEHPAVLEAAVVPSPDPVRHVVPKAFIALAPGYPPDADTARQIFSYLRNKLAAYKRIRRLEFIDLPKTASGKIRRAELRRAEQNRFLETARRQLEFLDQDF